MPTISDSTKAQALADIQAIADTEATYTQSAQWWSVALDDPGVAVRNENDLNQCIKIILGTPQGSDPFRPAFATGLHDLIDRPQSTIGPALVRECTQAVERWEPRVEVRGIDLYFNDPDSSSNTGRVDVNVRWGLKEGVETGSATLTVG